MRKSPLIPLIFSLILIGLIFVSVASLSEANSTIGDKFFFFKKQIFWIVLGFITFFITSKIEISKLKKISFPLYSISIIALILVLIPGFSNQTLGAHRWFNLGIFSVQPSEILKFTSIIYFPLLFSQVQNRNIQKLMIYLGIPFLLIILEPNLSTATLISAIVVSIYYLSGGEIKSLVGLCIGALFLGLLLIFISPYRSSRLQTLLNPQKNNTTSSYHSNQIILTLASGGLFGKGFANSEQKYRFLPKISTDSILAVIGEEIGFIGLFIIILLYVFLISYLFKLSKLIADDLFSSLLVAGIACWLSFQTLINLTAIVALIPLTGVPLPFISYGGSSLLTLMGALGIVRHIELIYFNNGSKKSTHQKNYHHRHPSYSRHRINPSASI